MAAVGLDAYTAVETTHLIAKHAHPGSVECEVGPTPDQLEGYVAAVRSCQDLSAIATLPLNVGRKR
jgi:hypothetical protein